MRAPHTILSLLLVCATSSQAAGQNDDAEATPTAPALPEIADEPRTVDPSSVMPEALAARVTVDFSDSSFREVVQWLRSEQKLVVLLDRKAISGAGVLLAEPISDRLDEAPLYLLLNRLATLKLAWYFDDQVLHITTQDKVAERLTTVPHNIAQLLDDGYTLDDLTQAIQATVAPDSWEEVGGGGALSILGDVMFVRQTDNTQREIQALLAALKSHGRRTLVLDPAQHHQLREALQTEVTVAFRDTPLEEAVAQLATDTKADIRLDTRALRGVRVREREPITLSLTDRKLRTVLQAMLLDLELTWVLQDGVLWVTTPARAEAMLKAAVYDVRDLCRDRRESAALQQALTSQIGGELWDDTGGPGAMYFARPGTLLVYHKEAVQQQVLALLATYRTALRQSRPRQRDEEDPNAVVTVYYRMHANVAKDLVRLLPQLAAPETWKNANQPHGVGTILLTSSPPEQASKGGRLLKASASSDGVDGQTLITARAVLIVRQTRAVHDEIARTIRRVETGDAPNLGKGGGLGGGGFGGGFFSVRE